MELPVASNAFQIKPDLDNILHTNSVKQLIQKVVNDNLLSKSFFRYCLYLVCTLGDLRFF